jgi:sigma-B regulation protein RsbU (phosphoserine phosphatase)
VTDRKQINFVRSADRRSQVEPVALNRRRGERRVDDLSWIPLFRDADPVAVHAALSVCKLLELPVDYCLLQPGAANHTIYIPLSGIVVAQLDDVAGPDASIEIAPGECVGELSAIDGKPRDETAERVI